MAVGTLIKAHLITGLSLTSHDLWAGSHSWSLIMSSPHFKSFYTFLHANNDNKSSLEAISDEMPSREIGNDLSGSLKTNYSSSSLKLSIEIIPDDVIFEVARHASHHNVLQMCLASRARYNLLKPILYSSVDLDSTESCRETLKLFSQRPDITVLIQELTLRPSHPSGWAKSSETKIDEDWVSSVVEEIVSAGHLRSLTSFLWDGMESPRDSLWTALRFGCPHLRTLGSSVGPRTQAVNPDSDIFNFKDLKGFSLSTQRLQRWTSYTPYQKLPVRMWNMLLIHSPRLQTLYIDGTCHLSQLWEVRPMLTGRWDQLRKFAAGNIFPVDVPIQESTVTISKFLQNHPSLENVAALGFMSFSHQSLITLSTLPKWNSYRGKLLQLKNVPIECSLWKVVLTDWLSPRVNFSDTPILALITSLSICVNFVDRGSKEELNFFTDFSIHVGSYSTWTSHARHRCYSLISLVPSTWRLSCAGSCSLGLGNLVRTILQKLQCVRLERTMACASSHSGM